LSRPAHGGNLAWAAALAGCPPEAIVDFSASINPLGPPQSAITAIQSHLVELTAYPDPDYGELREALGSFHQLSPQWILPGNGSAELLTLASWDLSQLGCTYLITPAFGDYKRALRAFDTNVLECPLSLKLGNASLAAALATVAFHPSTSNQGLLINNPHNPTGLCWSRETILPYLERFALVVVDEAFMDFLPPEAQQSLVPMVQDYPNLVIIRSLTKFYSLPGLRLGYCIAHPARLRQWQLKRDPWPVNILAAAAGIAAIQDRNFQQQTWDWLPPTRQALYEGLSEMPGFTPGAGAANFLLVQTEQSSPWLQKTLLQRRHLLIRDCLSFPELGEHYFRVAVRTQPENEQLILGLQEIVNG
jgi:L-threonine-O-3-phosphate decarboxylase